MGKSFTSAKKATSSSEEIETIVNTSDDAKKPTDVKTTEVTTTKASTPMPTASDGKKPSNSDCISQLKNPSKELRVTGEDDVENPTLEIALLMDCTASMQSWIDKAKETLNEIIDKVIEECKEEGNLKVRVCFIGYRDIKEKERFRVLEFTENIDQVREFIKQSHAIGGGDAPEDVQGGLKLALLQDWTEEATRRVFLICDAPCHGKQYHSESDDFPNGSPEGLVLEDMMKEFCKKEIEFQVIKLSHSCDKMIETMKSCHQELEVTDMTGIKRAAPSYSHTLSASMGARAEAATASYDRDDEMMMDTLECAKSSMKMMDRGCAMESKMMKMDYEEESRDYFRSEAVKGLSMQVQRKQMAKRSKRSIF